MGSRYSSSVLQTLLYLDFYIIIPKQQIQYNWKVKSKKWFWEEVKNWFIQKTKYYNNIYKAYALVLVRRNKGLKNKLQTGKYWEADKKNQPIGILKVLKEITHNYQYSRYPSASIFKVDKNVVNIKQY